MSTVPYKNSRLFFETYSMMQINIIMIDIMNKGYTPKLFKNKDMRFETLCIRNKGKVDFYG